MRLKFWRRVEKRSISTLPWDHGGTLNPAAVSVDRALQLAPVYAAGRLLASSVASLPLQGYRKAGEARQKIPLPSLFASPSVEGTLHDWLFRAMTSLIYRGNAVGLVTARDGFAYPVMIEWLNPSDIQVQDSNMSGPGSFTDPIWYWKGRVLPRDDIVHIPWFVLPGRVWGLSPIEAYAATVNIGLAAQIYSTDWFNSGGAPVGTFANADKEIDPSEAATIKQRLVTAMRSHEPIVHGRGWKYEVPVSISQQDAAFIETMKLGASQIAAIYGIPPEMIGGETGSSMTYANVEQQSINFIQFTLLPWITRLESAFFALLPRPQYVKFNVDALIRVDSRTRWGNYQIARNIGLMNVDELRALEDLPPLPDGQGQDYAPLAVTVNEAEAQQQQDDQNSPALPDVVPLNSRR